MANLNPPFSNLQLVERVETWPYFTADPESYKQHMQNYYYFLISDFKKPFGYIHHTFVKAMPWPEFWKIDHEERCVTLTGAGSFEERTKTVNETLRRGHEGVQVLDMDGCGVDVLGIVNYSVHTIGWVMTKEGRKYWVPRRSRQKMSFPGMLNNTVGGSLASGERAIDGIVRECEEEISLDPAYTYANIKACGTASYQMTRTDRGEPGCQFQVQYLYEMEFREDMVPRIGDGEVEELNLLTLDEVQAALKNGEFKLNCAMTWLSYLIRHGYLNAENEPDLVAISWRLHRKHDLFIV